MAVTLASMIANVQRRVDSRTTADADVVANKIGQVFDEITAMFAPQHPNYLRTSDTFATVAGTREYSSSDLSGGDTVDTSRGILKITPPAGYDENGLGQLQRISQDEMLQRYPDTTETDTPRYYCMVGPETWWLGPTPDAALTFTMVFYKRSTIPEDSGDSIDLPDDICRVAENGAVAYFKDERGDVDADIALKLYTAGLEQAITRYFPDEYESYAMLQHEPIYYGQRYSSKSFC